MVGYTVLLTESVITDLSVRFVGHTAAFEFLVRFLTASLCQKEYILAWQDASWSWELRLLLQHMFTQLKDMPNKTSIEFQRLQNAYQIVCQEISDQRQEARGGELRMR
jgi:hypothetical protein